MALRTRDQVPRAEPVDEQNGSPRAQGAGRPIRRVVSIVQSAFGLPMPMATHGEPCLVPQRGQKGWPRAQG